MAAARKVLWVVNYDTLDAFVTRAVAVKATAVAIRTDNDIAKAVTAFHAKGIQVFGWRWPLSTAAGAAAEAARANAFYAAGMDGYYVDPEGQPGKAYDWDQPGLEDEADAFCKAITTANPGKPFGVTSHFRGVDMHPHLPWKTFFKYATVLLPQAYWRVTAGNVGSGKPDDIYQRSIAQWTKTGGDAAKIVPMAGELGSVTGAEVKTYAATAAAAGRHELHFYTWEKTVAADVWTAVAEA